MPPTKAAKKVAIKSATKVATKGAKKAAKKTAKSPGHDLRRAYEHLHRVNIMHGALPEPVLSQLDTLSRTAQSSLAAGEDKSAADLLRAAEHLAFGSLAGQAGDPGVAAALVAAAHEEYERLTTRAAERWAEREGAGPRAVTAIYRSMLAEAKAAMKAGALHRGLEFARGAEALSHVEASPSRLSSGRELAGRLRA